MKCVTIVQLQTIHLIKVSLFLYTYISGVWMLPWKQFIPIFYNWISFVGFTDTSMCFRHKELWQKPLSWCLFVCLPAFLSVCCSLFEYLYACDSLYLFRACISTESICEMQINKNKSFYPLINVKKKYPSIKKG